MHCPFVHIIFSYPKKNGTCNYYKVFTHMRFCLCMQHTLLFGCVCVKEKDENNSHIIRMISLRYGRTHYIWKDLLNTIVGQCYNPVFVCYSVHLSPLFILIANVYIRLHVCVILFLIHLVYISFKKFVYAITINIFISYE